MVFKEIRIKCWEILDRRSSLGILEGILEGLSDSLGLNRFIWSMLGPFSAVTSIPLLRESFTQ